ncbi:putative cell division protein SepF [Staphylococcus aureus subsp. aureus 21259]|nr:putative cell division protein SepF [Staphylococcus aureus subsp. aureus 21259]
MFFQIHKILLMSLKTAVRHLSIYNVLIKYQRKELLIFLSGTVYAIGGDIQRVGTDIFLCTPDNVEVAGSITDHIENMEHSFD